MALILNIDTSTENALVCLAKDGEVIDSLQNTNQKDHASFLQVAINVICKKNNIILKNIDAVAVTEGPGSYTGLRVGLASAKGICYALNKPLILLNTLKVIAYSAISSSAVFAKNNTALICPMIDARRMEVFTAVYDKQLNEIISPCALILNEQSFIEILEQSPILFVGNGAKKINLVQQTHFNIVLDEINASNTAISYLANQSYVNQLFTSVIYSEPLYIKPFLNQTTL
ncbi:MAG: tRNA (adenosine(37)-N6)-threonylcarbamoyltransferase complex dimerization subunit type 1 TsaB [Ferruginibacter sp.]|nr:tRNA (adenosine(37)-N6)-threonylcarbamoyltransferase complex dimerization subunit type 1 TsaB [Ferruginibacter sp.]